MSTRKAPGAADSVRSISDSSVRNVINGASSQDRVFHRSPRAWEDQQLYFLLPDRFANGEERESLDLNSKPIQGDIEPFTSSDSGNAIQSSIESRDWEEAGVVFQGGTLRGVQSKLGYLRRLGVTAVWIGPIFKQVPKDDHLYHGYAVQDFLDIDPHFGSREDLRDLVKSAHEQGIYVILDIILNHSGDVFAYQGGGKRWTGRQYDVEGFRDPDGEPNVPFEPLQPDDAPNNIKDYAIWPQELQTPETFTREGEISNWDYWPEYIRGDFLTLKDIDLGPSDPDTFIPSPALQTLCEVYKYWIAYADLDGYRIDTVKHMGDGPTRYLCTVLHEFASTIGKDNYFLVGEVTGGRAFDTVEVTGLDAALAVGNIQEKLWKIPKGYANPTEFFDLFRNATYLKKGTNAWMKDKLVTMIDDHDQVWRGGMDKARFCSDYEGKHLVLPAIALNLTTLGIPCIYYGTEQSFDGTGGSDRYIREAMFGGSFGAFRSKDRHFFDESGILFRQIAKISQLRQQHPALRRGRQYLREISSDGEGFGFPHILGGRMKSIVAWSRVFADREILCAINTDIDNYTEAFVTVDAGLHPIGTKLKNLYVHPDAKGFEGYREVEAVGKHRRMIRISIPPCGFVMYN